MTVLAHQRFGNLYKRTRHDLKGDVYLPLPAKPSHVLLPQDVRASPALLGCTAAVLLAERVATALLWQQLGGRGKTLKRARPLVPAPVGDSVHPPSVGPEDHQPRCCLDGGIPAHGAT